RDRSCDKSLCRPGLNRIGCCLLALRVGISRTLRYVDLRFACYLRSSLHRFRRRVERPASVAGSFVACGADGAPYLGLVQASRGYTTLTIPITAVLSIGSYCPKVP